MEDNNEIKPEVQNKNPKAEKKQRKKMDTFSKVLIGISGTLVVGFAGIVGITLYSRSKDIALYGVPGISTPMINAHNNIIQKYLTAGNDSITGIEVNSLLNELKDYQNSKEIIDIYGEITYIGSGENVPKTINDQASTKYRYKVSCTYYETGSPYAGCVKTVTVSQAE